MGWPRLVALPLLVLVLSTPVGAGTADQVGATFGLLIQDVVAAFPPVEGLVVHGQQGLDVGEQVHARLVSTDPQRGYIDFWVSAR